MKNKEEIINHFKHLLNMAIADLNIDSRELKLIYDLGVEKGIKEEEINILLETPDHSFLKAPSEIEGKIELLFDLCLVIWADDKVEKEERELLEKVIEQCDFKRENVGEIASYLLEQVKIGVSLDVVLKEVEENLKESNNTQTI